MRQAVIHYFALLLVLVIASPAFAEKRVALVIGNSAYKNVSVLKNPVNDAQLMAKVLKAQGFEVVLGIDLEYRAMKRAIRQYTAKLRSYGRDTIGFIFYAGHGLQVRGANYLVPVRAEIENEGDVDIEAVSASSLLFGVREARNRLNIIVLDACRNNPYRSLFRSVNRGLRSMNAPMGSLIAFSTSPGDVAADGAGKNSPFTSALAKSMMVRGLTIERVFKTARQKVYDSSNKKQLPWINSSLLGEFYPAGQLKKKANLEPVRPSIAALEWKGLQNSNDADDLEAYVKQFGKRFPYYGRKARKRLGELKEKVSPNKKAAKDGGERKDKKITTISRQRNEEETGGGQKDLSKPTDANAKKIRHKLASLHPSQSSNLAGIPSKEAANRAVHPSDMQRELKRIGCYRGRVDGTWGPRSNAALQRVAKARKTSFVKPPLSPPNLSILKSLNSLVCKPQSTRKASRTKPSINRPSTAKNNIRTKRKQPAKTRTTRSSSGRSTCYRRAQRYCSNPDNSSAIGYAACMTHAKRGCRDQ